MKLHFTISEFNISGEPIPEMVADKLLHHHILPMQTIREKMNIPITASLKSGYRSLEWEKSKGRSGASQHTFGAATNDPHQLGAIDWTCQNFTKNKDEFLRLIVQNTSYTRMAVYNNFIHCDYKKTPSGQREIYLSDAHSNWTLKRKL